MATATINTFYAKAKRQPPDITFEMEGGKVSCCVTLPALLDAENQGWPEMSFREVATSKKESKNLAMQRALDFIQPHPVFRKYMTETTSAWGAIEALLITDKLIKTPDVRVNAALALAHLDGHIPLGALLSKPNVQRVVKAHGQTAQEQLPWLLGELDRSSPSTDRLELDPLRATVRLKVHSQDDAAAALNPGYCQLRPGPTAAADAVRVLWGEDMAHPGADSVSAFVVPADPSLATREVAIPCRGHFWTTIATHLSCPVGALARIKSGPPCAWFETRAALEGAILAADEAQDASGLSGGGGCPAKRQRCASCGAGTEDARSAQGAPAADCHQSPESLEAAAPCVPGKRKLGTGGPSASKHPALAKTNKSPECYVAAELGQGHGHRSLPLNHRGSLIAGCVVRGDLLVTNIRCAAPPPEPATQDVAGDGPRLSPVLVIQWAPISLPRVLRQAATHLSSASETAPLIARLPAAYARRGWTGPEPSQLLHSYAARWGCAPTQDGPKYAGSVSALEERQTARCSVTLSRLGLPELSASGSCPVGSSSQQATTPEVEAALVAREEAALALLHWLEASDVAAFVSERGGQRDGATTAAADTPGSAAHVEAEGQGPRFSQGDLVKAHFKAEVALTGIAGGGVGHVAKLDSGAISFVLGCGAVAPQVEALAMQLKPGGVGRTSVWVPIGGRNPFADAQQLVKCDVQLSVSASAASPAALFEPSLARQRHDFICRVLSRHGSVSAVVDLGCGEGNFIKVLLTGRKGRAPRRVVGLDVSEGRLVRAGKIVAVSLLHHINAGPAGAERPSVQLFKGDILSPAFRSPGGWGRLDGCDAAVACEVVEHMYEPDGLAAAMLGGLRPRVAIITTPNVEYNLIVRNITGGPADRLRDPDHKFEWTRAQFEEWARRHAAEYGYEVTFDCIGRVLKDRTADEDVHLGGATQAAVFVKVAAPVQGPAAQACADLKAELVFSSDSLSLADMERTRVHFNAERNEEYRARAAAASAPAQLGDVLAAFDNMAGLCDGDASMFD